jgi:hypothetical protein
MIIDVNVDITQHLSALKKAGVTDIIGYLNPHGQTSKVVTPARAKAIAAAGMTLALVSEGWGDFQHGDISAAAGKRDAEHALAALPTLGASPTAAVYFAVDTDASTGQIQSLVVPYFKAIKAAFAGSKYRIGAYASGAVCNACLALGLIDFSWITQSNGFLGTKEFLASGRWTLHQQMPAKVAGIDCDPDVANTGVTDWGQFVPFALVPAANTVELSPAGYPVASAKNVADARLTAATGAMHNLLANGIAKFVPDWPSWLKVDIPAAALEHMAPALAQAALNAADGAAKEK